MIQTVTGHQINVTSACADAGSTLHVLKRKNVYQENANVRQ